MCSIGKTKHDLCQVKPESLDKAKDSIHFSFTYIKLKPLPSLKRNQKDSFYKWDLFYSKFKYTLCLSKCSDFCYLS